MNNFKIAEFKRLSALSPNALSVDAFSVLSSEVQKSVLVVLDYAQAPDCALSVRSCEIERVLLSVAMRITESATDALCITYAQCSQLNKYTHSKVACSIELLCKALTVLGVARTERTQDERALRFDTSSALCCKLLDKTADVADMILGDADFFADIVLTHALVFIRDDDTSTVH